MSCHAQKETKNLLLQKVCFVQCAVLTVSLTESPWYSAKDVLTQGNKGETAPVLKQSSAEHHADTVKEAVKTVHCTKHTVGESKFFYAWSYSRSKLL